MARKRRFWPWITVAVLATAPFAAWRVSDLGRASASLQTQLAEARREGVPMGWDDLRRLEPPVPLNDNAAVLYDQAITTLNASGTRQSFKPALLTELEQGTIKWAEFAKLRSALATAAPALELARKGTACKGFSYEREWEKGSALTFPEYADLGHLVRALVLRAMLAKTPQAAADDLRVAARIRADVGSEPLMIAALVGLRMESDIQHGVRDLGRRSDAWRTAARAGLDGLGPIPKLQRSIAAEAVWGNHFTEEIEKLGPGAFTAMGFGSASTPIALRLATFRPVREAYRARVVEYWRGVWKALPQDPTDAERARAALAVPSGDRGLSYAMLDILLPVFDQFAEANARAEANRRLSRTALDLWAGRSPALPRDPFGTGPIRLQRRGSDWILYSVGPDRIDDRGKPQTKSSDVRYDLVVDSTGALQEKR